MNHHTANVTELSEGAASSIAGMETGHPLTSPSGSCAVASPFNGTAH